MIMRQADGRMRHAGAGAARRLLRPLLLLPLLAGCGGATPGDANGEWSGRLVTQRGSCPEQLSARLLVDGRDVSFIPSGGVLVLHGRRTPGDPRLHAQLALTDMNRKPLPIVFEGRLAPDGSHVDGIYGTPTCRAAVTLLRPASHPLDRALGN